MLQRDLELDQRVRRPTRTSQVLGQRDADCRLLTSAQSSPQRQHYRIVGHDAHPHYVEGWSLTVPGQTGWASVAECVGLEPAPR